MAYSILVGKLRQSKAVVQLSPDADYLGSTFGARLHPHVFHHVFGPCTLWHRGSHSAKLSWPPGMGQSGASGRSWRWGWHNARAGQGLPCWGSAGGTRATVVCCPSSSSSSSSSLPPPQVCARIGGYSPTVLLLLQPSPCHTRQPPWAGSHIQPCGAGAELPGQCQHCLFHWESTSCRGGNLARLQTGTGATGSSSQRLVSGD